GCHGGEGGNEVKTLTSRCDTSALPRSIIGSSACAVTAAKIWSRERTRMLSGFPNPEHLRCELRIDFDELRGDRGPQDAQRLRGRIGRYRHVVRHVNIEAG